MRSGFQKVLSMFMAVAIIAVSCDSDDEFDPGTAPEIPPITTMVMDVDNFVQGSTSSAFVDGRVKTQVNWQLAAVQVGFWNLILGSQLVLPVLAFEAAISETPEYDGERGLWVWTFDYNHVGRTYTAELTGQIIEDMVEWKMYISQQAGFQDILWYSGTMQLDGSSGEWTLRRNENNPTDYLSIDWERQSEEVGSIRYELIDSEDEAFGSYIEYGRTTGGDYNVYYTIVITSTEKSAEIEWNDETGAGRVEYNNSGEYFCWDSNFEDVDCE